MKKRSFFSPYLEEANKKKRKVLRKKMVIIVAISLLVLVGIGALSRWQKTRIQGIEVSGNKVTDSIEVEKVVNQEIAGNYLWFFPKANFLIYPKGKIKKVLAENFKIFKNIDIELDSSRVLQITVTEREGKYIWCGATPQSETPNTTCDFMDDGGYIFTEAPYFSGNVFLKFFGAGAIGSNFAPSLFSKLITFNQAVEDMGLKTISYYVENGGDIDLYLNSKATPSDGPKIVLNNTVDFDQAVGTLETAITTNPLQTDLKKNMEGLEYIDLRFGNKVYYKFN